MGKINSITNQLVWERIYTVLNFTGNGTFNSLIEDGEVIIAAGEQAECGSSNRKMILNKVLSSNGDPIIYTGSTYYPIAIFSNSFNSRLNEVKPIRDGSGDLIGIIGIGSKNPVDGNNEKAIFTKLDAQGDPDQSFGNGGYFELNDSRDSRGLNGILVEGHNTIKYALVGRILETTSSSVHNALIVTIDADGDLVYKEELGETGNESGITQDFGYVDINSGNEYNSCLNQNYEGTDQLARDIIQDGDYFVISAEYDWFGTTFSLGTCGQNLDGDDTYRMIDGVLIKMEIDDGDVYFGENVGLFEGDAFYCDLEIKDGSYYVLGSTAQVINGRLSSKTQVVKTDDEGAILYTKTVNKPGNATWETDCGFDMAFDCNDELIIGGDANVNEEDYFVQVLSSDCLSSFSYTSSDNITISSPNTVWNTSRSIKGTVTIESGGVLIINSAAVIQFGASWETNDLDILSTNGSTVKTGRIVVKSGGKLRLDNCTLKGVYACGKDWMWDGIELQNGGQVFQANGAIIQDAKIGILAGSGSFSASGTFNPTEADGGGTISATSGTILDCRRCIHFAPCTSNASTVAGIDFVSSGFLKDPSYRHFVNFPPSSELVLTGMCTKEFVTANSATGMVFDGCTWTNTSSVPKGWKGKGINSYNSAYQYTGGCEMTGLQTGIFAISAADPTKFIYVSGANNFSDNSIAIRFTGGSNHIIANENTFNMTINASHPGLGSKPDGIAIYNGGATKIKIENNEFNGASSSYGPQAYGIINENTGPDATHHKKNTFNTLLYGEQTQRNNGGMNLWCNEHDDNIRAWNINPSTFGVFPDQGICNLSYFVPENFFYDACPQSQINHIRSTLTFDYWYKNSEQDFPQCNSNNVDVQQCSEFVINTGCDESIYLNPANADDYLTALPEMPASPHRQELVNDLIRHYIMEQDMTTVKEILAGESGISYRFDLAFILLNEGEFTYAQDTISNLNASDPEVIDMVRFFNVVKAALMDDRSLAELLTSEIDTLEVLSENRTLGAYQAQAILMGLYGYNFPALVETDSSLVERSQKKINGILDKETVLRIQPNPVSDLLMIEIPTFNNFRERSLLLTSIDGKILLKIALKIGQTQIKLDLSSLAQGVYSLHLVDSSKIFPPQKLVKY